MNRDKHAACVVGLRKHIPNAKVYSSGDDGGIVVEYEKVIVFVKDGIGVYDNTPTWYDDNKQLAEFPQPRFPGGYAATDEEFAALAGAVRKAHEWSLARCVT